MLNNLKLKIIFRTCFLVLFLSISGCSISSANLNKIAQDSLTGIRKIVDTICTNWFAYRVNKDSLIRNKFYKR